MSGLEDMEKMKDVIDEINPTAGDDDPDFELTEEQAMKILSQAGGNQQGLVAALQGHLGELLGTPSGFVESLPKAVRRRVDALQDLQKEHDDLEEEFKKERAALEAKYRALYEPLYVKRSAIVTGAEEPQSKEENDEEEEEEDGEEEVGEETKGIPEFWLCVLRNHDVTEEQITEKDAEALKFLNDIKSEPLDGDDVKGFKLTFYFDPNPFFENETLTKTYNMIDEDDPILEHTEGTDIKWKPGKNLTVKIMKKKPKKGKAGGKPITKSEPCESFFNFFSPPKIPDDADELEEEEMEQLQEVMEADYEIGSSIKEKLIPHAVSWFTGEAVAMDDESDDDEDDDGDENDEDEEGDEEGKSAPKGLEDIGEKPPECKQQ
mmetsp:Transcript_21656/g.60192  ORF Transcript_21656/g.60192 Transcript_21656/m.60192 type:complete len:377 (-) Transcript_21656:211-1341(-)|eukprot:CAMPEP_0117668852 /NCGR_PEP_ID=MMETSP0804-20121206/11788_1 /TAXON_ID=1074897 /ORGANISM="Tetraselmis astigmatica, Strain CCMP880" /LENGTH=376 /DNA_ID=CAMNT_0005476807 /DNA_START=208 /DNA_END=1338 /DNA_ORIENTATION=-